MNVAKMLYSFLWVTVFGLLYWLMPWQWATFMVLLIWILAVLKALLTHGEIALEFIEVRSEVARVMETMSARIKELEATNR